MSLETVKKTIDDYMSGVIDGSVVACKYVRLAVQRHLDDLEHGHERGLYFDEEAAYRPINLTQQLKHSKGEWAGKPLILEPWQLFIKWVVFGWMGSDGYRRFTKMYEEVARKNGKSTDIASVGVYGLGFDKEPGAEVYSVATKEDQAMITLSEGQSMVRKSGNLDGNAEVYKKSIVLNGSSWKPLGRDTKSEDGRNPHMCLIDEYHAHPDRTMYDVLDSADGARRQPLLCVITTAGFNKQSPCYLERDYVIKVLEGTVKDDSYFGIIFTLDEGDEWDDESVWIKSNPNLGVSVYLKNMQQKCLQAKESTSKINNFLTKRLNIWTTQEIKWVNMVAWVACSGSVSESTLVGKKCFGGLDLASNTDIASYVMAFPWHNGTVAVLPRFWIPEDNARERERKDRVPYLTWAKQGFIKLTPGNVIDYHTIMHDVLSDIAKFDMQLFGFDRWGFEAMRQRLIEEGAPDNKMFSFGQGYASMSAPCKELERLYMDGKLSHNNNPVLNWMASNAQATMDPAGNVKLDKSKSTEKIDGMVALLMAIGVMITQPDALDYNKIFAEVGI